MVAETPVAVAEADVLEKVVAYVTNGGRLLVFSHPHHPEAGIQVPAGTVEPGESPYSAVLREALEETGLEGLAPQSYLGTRELGRAAVCGSGRVRFHFYHLSLPDNAPDRWRHFEEHPSDGSTEPIEFELYWVRFPCDVPELLPPQGDMLHKLGLEGLRR